MKSVLIRPFSRWRVLSAYMLGAAFLCGLVLAGVAVFNAPHPRSEAQDVASIQRFIHRMRLSEQDGKTPVKVLFYGQSITRQEWSQIFQQRLQKDFSQVRWEFFNLAVGGHSSQILQKLVDSDVLPLQPDLVIFHVYGDSRSYEKIIQSIRTGTTADVIIATDHILSDSELSEEANPFRQVESTQLRKLLISVGVLSAKSTFDSWRNHHFLPQIAQRYGCALLDVRQQWRLALLQSGHPSAHYLSDQVHLNSNGNALMAEVVYKSMLTWIRLGSNHPVQHDPLTKTVQVDLTHPSCTPRAVGPGYRIKMLGAGPELQSVRVNGQAPEQDQDTLWYSRVSQLPGTDWPALLRVDPQTLSSAPDDWLIQLKQDAASGATRFKVTSRLLGDEGSGRTDEPFMARSGRFGLRPEDWNIDYAKSVHPNAKVDGAEVSFKSFHLGASMPVFRANEDSALLYERRGNADLEVCLQSKNASAPSVVLEIAKAPYECHTILGQVMCQRSSP